MNPFVTWSSGVIAGAETPDGKLPEGLTPDLLGGKGFGLAAMCAKGYPVPPGFTITTDVCRAYWKKPEPVLDAIREDLAEAMGWLTDTLGYEPLVSVRSGARISMPGMMDTVLNVGLTSKNAARWWKKLGGQTYGDSRRRLLQMYGAIVLSIPKNEIDAVIRKACRDGKVDDVSKLSGTKLLGLSQRLENMYAEYKRPMPNDPEAQIIGAVQAVFDSWHSERAIAYRKAHKIPDDIGTAVNVQTMVFGNAGPDCGTGVLFTGNPATGESGIVGEFLVNAQGEDVVAGTHQPLPFVDKGAGITFPGMESKAGEIVGVLNGTGENVLKLMAALGDLRKLAYEIEADRGDMQDIEFTVEYGKLWLLQTRNAKRSGVAAINMVRAKYEKGELDAAGAAKAISFSQFAAAQKPILDEANTQKLLGKPSGQGIGASVGAVVGRAAMSLDEINAIKGQGHPAIYVADETTPDDIACILAADGIITARGGFTSHAAVVARSLEKPCVVGCDELDMHGASLKAGHTMPALGSMGLPVGTWLTLDASTGKVWMGKGATLDAGAWVRAFVSELATGAGMVLRDEHPIPGGHVVAAPAIASGGLREWLSGFYKLGLKDVLIDLRLPAEWANENDREFMTLTGDVPERQMELVVDALCEFTGEGVRLYIPWLHTRADLVKRVEAAKYAVLPIAQTLAEAMAGSGKVVLASSLLQAIGEGAAKEAVITMLAQNGVEASAGLDSVTLGEAAATLLG